MAPWRCDPYLWVHLAGLATVPLWIDLCLLGLAVGNPTLPELELGVIGVLGVLPVLVMQLRRPFYIFSLPGLALKPAALQDDQRRLLSQFRRWRVRLGALLVPVPLVWGLLKLYPLAFLARDLTPFEDWGRWGGVAIAALSFLMANLFLQIPVAVLQVLATPSRTMARVSPYPAASIGADFTWLGLPVGKILPSPERPIAEVAAPGMAAAGESDAASLGLDTREDSEHPGSGSHKPDGAASELFPGRLSSEHSGEAVNPTGSAVHPDQFGGLDSADLDSADPDLSASDAGHEFEADPAAESVAEQGLDHQDVNQSGGPAPLPVCHPELEEVDQGLTYLEDVDYLQPPSAIASPSPKLR